MMLKNEDETINVDLFVWIAISGRMKADRAFALYRLVRWIIVIIIRMDEREEESERERETRRDDHHDAENFKLAAVTPPPSSPLPRRNSRDINY